MDTQLSFVDATNPTTTGTTYQQSRLERKLGQISTLTVKSLHKKQEDQV